MQRIAIVSKDRSFWTIARSALGIDSQFEVVHFDRDVVELESAFPEDRFDAYVIDMDATKLLELEALHRISKRFSGQVPILAVLEKHSNASIRVLFHLKISDFVVKPVTAS